MASGWNVWVWLVTVVVRRYIIDILIIIITFPYSTCINSFFGSIIPISLFIFKCFFVLYNCVHLQKISTIIVFNTQEKICFFNKGMCKRGEVAPLNTSVSSCH